MTINELCNKWDFELDHSDSDKMYWRGEVGGIKVGFGVGLGMYSSYRHPNEGFEPSCVANEEDVSVEIGCRDKSGDLYIPHETPLHLRPLGEVVFPYASVAEADELFEAIANVR